MHSALGILGTVSGMIALAVFAWGFWRRFRSPAAPRRMLLMAAASAAGFVIYVQTLWAVTPGWLVLVGAWLQFNAVALFLAAIAASRSHKPGVPPLRGGPRTRVRHPLYASYALFWIGCAVSVNRLGPWLVAGLFVAVYLFAAAYVDLAPRFRRPAAHRAHPPAGAG